MCSRSECIQSYPLILQIWKQAHGGQGLFKVCQVGMSKVRPPRGPQVVSVSQAGAPEPHNPECLEEDLSATVPKFLSNVGRSKVKIKTQLVTWQMWALHPEFHWTLPVVVSQNLWKDMAFDAAPPTWVQITEWLCGSNLRRLLIAVFQQQPCSILHFYKANCLP